MTRSETIFVTAIVLLVVAVVFGELYLRGLEQRPSIPLPPASAEASVSAKATTDTTARPYGEVGT